MRDEQIIARCVEHLGMTKEEGQWVASNLDKYIVPDFSEWSWRQIDQAFKDVLSFKQEAHQHNYEWSRYCGAQVCIDCDDHKGLARCYCGWSASGGNGRQELIDCGETIEEVK